MDRTSSVYGRLSAIAGLALVLLAAVAAALTVTQSAQAATCSAAAVTVTPMHSPDGTQRPFYSDDFGGGTSNHSGYVGYELSGAALGTDVWIKLSGFSGGALGLAASQSASIPVRATSQAGHPLVYAYLSATAISASAQTFTVEVWNGKPGQAGSTQVCAASDGFSSVTKVISAAANKITAVTLSNGSPAIGGSFDISADGDTGTVGGGPASDQDSSGNGVFSMAPAMSDAWPADAFTLTGTQVAFTGGSTYRDKLRVYLPHSNGVTYTTTYHFTVRGTTSGPTAVYPVQNIASGTQVKYTGTFPGTISQIATPAVSASLVKTATSLVGPPYHVTYQVVVSNSSASPVTLDSLRDSPTPTGPSNWTFDTGTAKLGGTAIADPVLDSGSLVFTGPFSVPGSGSLTFTYKLALSTTVANSVVGTVGGVDIGASSGTGNQVSVDPSAPVVTTASLPNGSAGSSYSHTLAASGGTGSYTWAVTSGSLPGGLTLNPSTGAISGTPAAAGASTFTVAATDGTPKSGSKSLTLTVDAAPGGGGGGGGADTTAPTGSVTLNAGAAATSFTTLSVGLAATDAVGVTAYRFASGADCSAAAWTPVTSTTSLSTTASLSAGAGDGTKTVCAQFKDAAGNVSTTSTATIALDTTAPTVVLSSAAASTVTGPFAVTATFSESVTGFTASDVTVGNGSVTGLSGSGTTYTFSVTPTADGSVTIDVPAAAAADAVGNTSTAATQLSRSADVTRPSVALTSAAPSTTSAPFTVTATFSESVTGFSVADITVGNGAASGLTGSGTTYSFTVTPAADGPVTVDVGTNAAADGAGNGNLAATQLARTYAATAPTVALSTPATSPLSSAFIVTATFSESVSGFDSADLVIGNGAVSSFSGSGTTYTFTVTPAADGSVTVDVPAAAAISGTGTASLAATRLTRTADLTRPSVVLTTGAADPLTGPFTVTATFSESVTGFVAGDVTVGNGAVSGFSGSGTTYSFTVTPAADGAVTIDVAAGGAADAAGNGNSPATRLSRTADTTAPAVTLATSATSPVRGPVSVTATFSEPVTGFTAADLMVANAAVSAFAGSGATYTFTLTPAADGAVTADLPAGRATDAAGNANTAATRLSFAYDSTAPTVTITAGPALSTVDSVALFAFGADEAATFTCSLDGAAFAPCASPLTESSIDAGAHALVVHARDAAGNVGSSSYRWTVTLPVVTFSVTPSDPSEEDVTFVWSSTGVETTFTCTLDGRPGAACSSPFTITGLEDGLHAFTVVAHTGHTLSGSASASWTSHRRVAQPNVLIIPKISATDMLGRPQPFKQSVDAPHSLGPFTRKLQVKLHIPTPVGDDLQQIDNVYISNFPDFRNTQTFPVAADEQYDWELLAGPSGDRPVYIRFADTPDAPVGAATIVLDQELPSLTPTPLSTRTAARSVAVQRRAATYGTIYCGAAPRRFLQLPGADGFSGLNAVQIASDPAHPCSWRPYLPTISYRLPGKAVWIRIEDRVGNISAWYRVKTK